MWRELLEGLSQLSGAVANFALAHNQLAQAYLAKHINDEAVTELQRAMQLSRGQPVGARNLRVGLQTLAEESLSHSLRVRHSWQHLPVSSAPATGHNARNPTVQIPCDTAARDTTASTYR